MNKTLTLFLILALAACTREVSFDHNISAEFPSQKQLESVSVCFAAEGSADILVSTDGVINYGSLSVAKVTVVDEAQLPEILEETFWTGSSRQWLIFLETSLPCEGMSDCGFVNVLRARGLSQDGVSLWASSNVYDKISNLTVSPVSFTVKVWESGR